MMALSLRAIPVITQGYLRGRSRTLSGFAACRRASNAVEFALVAPLLCFMLLAIIYTGLYLGTAHSVAQVASDVSRYSLVGRSQSERHALAEKWMATTGGAYSLINMKRMSMQTDEAGDLLKVTIAYDLSYLPMPAIVRTMMDFRPTIVRTSAVYVR